MFLEYEEHVVHVQKDWENPENALVEVDTYEFVKANYNPRYITALTNFAADLWGWGWGANNKLYEADYHGYSYTKFREAHPELAFPYEGKGRSYRLLGGLESNTKPQPPAPVLSTVQLPPPGTPDPEPDVVAQDPGEDDNSSSDDGTYYIDSNTGTTVVPASGIAGKPSGSSSAGKSSSSGSKSSGSSTSGNNSKSTTGSGSTGSNSGKSSSSSGSSSSGSQSNTAKAPAVTPAPAKPPTSAPGTGTVIPRSGGGTTPPPSSGGGGGGRGR